MIENISAAVAGGLALAACSTQPAPPPSYTGQPPEHGVTTGHRCNPANIQQFVGRQATSELGSEMLGVSGAGILRWVAAGTMITMEYSPERLTVFLDRGNRVERISCS